MKRKEQETEKKEKNKELFDFLDRNDNHLFCKWEKKRKRKVKRKEKEKKDKKKYALVIQNENNEREKNEKEKEKRKTNEATLVFLSFFCLVFFPFSLSFCFYFVPSAVLVDEKYRYVNGSLTYWGVGDIFTHSVPIEIAPFFKEKN